MTMKQQSKRDSFRLFRTIEINRLTTFEILMKDFHIAHEADSDPYEKVPFILSPYDLKIKK